MTPTQTIPKAQLEDLCVNTIKFLAVDAVEKAKSGHPGTPMGAADAAFVLWSEYLHFDPKDPQWPGRDRFVLSAGHACMLQYALLHLFGFDLPLEQLEQFRQWGSHTPGHPERGDTAGVEVTTGPLGQGVGNAIGMAIAAKMLGSRLNGADGGPFSGRVYAIVSDGDMMEGVASEAASLAGHLGLENLTFLYDDNKITIEGSTDLAWEEDVAKRFESYGWHIQRIDGHDRAAIRKALDAAKKVGDRPQFIVCRTHIANGAPTKHDTAGAHGEPLGPEEAAATKKALGWPAEPAFFVPEEARAFYQQSAARKREERVAWDGRFAAWKSANPGKSQLWDSLRGGKLPADLEQQLLAAVPNKPDATRNLSSAILQKAAELVPALAGGSADLAPSTKTKINASPSIAKSRFEGRNFHFGIREHGMGSVMNGMACHGAFIPYGATFLQFADYMRASIRLAALMRLHTIYVFTHDSIFLGEDGPTHQPIEHVASLRLIPNLTTWRPADGDETALAWAAALRRATGPTALVLTRQKVPLLARAKPLDAATFARGGYVLMEATGGAPKLVIAASGSEVGCAVEARALLEGKNIPTRVVSMPSLETFDAQPRETQESILPRGVRIVSVEAGVPDPWLRHVGRDGLAIGIRRFGASAPAEVLAEKFGFTGAQVAAAAERIVG
jgi:transketolase